MGLLAVFDDEDLNSTERNIVFNDVRKNGKMEIYYRSFTGFGYINIGEVEAKAIIKYLSEQFKIEQI